jgi:chemotaxis protein MotA
MDFATIGGLVTCTVLILSAMMLGGSLGMYIDLSAFLIVFGGTIGSIFVMYPGGQVLTGLKAARIAFTKVDHDPEESIRQLSELSTRARREGLLSLESAAEETEDDFLKRGLQMVVDGQEASAIEDVLYSELDQIEERHKRSIAVFKGIGASGPAMGMIGTLIGLVQMLQNMNDPKAIGPAMAVALLTTFYGSLLANLIGIPISVKMQVRSGEEIAAKGLVAQGLLSILAGENPRFMVERLNATLPPAQRYSEEAA